jgi:hypothetical protein
MHLRKRSVTRIFVSALLQLAIGIPHGIGVQVVALDVKEEVLVVGFHKSVVRLVGRLRKIVPLDRRLARVVVRPDGAVGLGAIWKEAVSLGSAKNGRIGPRTFLVEGVDPVPQDVVGEGPFLEIPSLWTVGEGLFRESEGTLVSERHGRRLLDFMESVARWGGHVSGKLQLSSFTNKSSFFHNKIL